MAKPAYATKQYRTNRRLLLATQPRCSVPDCGAPATSADHIIPASKGGTADLANLRPMCQPHNSSRGARTTTRYKAAL